MQLSSRPWLQSPAPKTVGEGGGVQEVKKRWEFFLHSVNSGGFLRTVEKGPGGTQAAMCVPGEKSTHAPFFRRAVGVQCSSAAGVW